MFEQNAAIIRDESMLLEQFLPQHLLHRDGQRDFLVNALKPAAQGRKPRNVFLYGPCGTGKTAMVRWIFAELEKHASNVRTAYVNCWKRPTAHAALLEILTSMGVFATPREPVVELLQKYESAAKKTATTMVVCLDEVDQLEDDELLYGLSRSEAGVIAVSNNAFALMAVDDRIKSSLSLASLEFPAYTADEMFDILKQRAERAFVPGAVADAELRMASRLAAGDCRVGIEMLRKAALIAEAEEKTRVAADHVKKAFDEAKFLRKVKVDQKLNRHEKALLEIMEKAGRMSSGELYEKYRAAVTNAATERTFRIYMNNLVDLGLLRSVGEVRWRKYEFVGY